ncbi:MAG: cation:proton antiporter [Acidobacteria bacterium]|nr:cation:proton antiporter [Acidobacteriota bacterium]
MEQSHFLKDLVIVYVLGAFVVFFFQKLRQSNIVGFLVTGILVGPYGFSLVSDTKSVHILAEIGVMLLLFSLGLEFSFRKLMQLRNVVFGTGSVQVATTTLLVVGIASLAGVNIRTAVFFGFLAALSSTAIVVKMLIERGETDAIHGKVALGILIFQDLCVVPMIVLVPLLAEPGSIWLPLGVALGKAAAVIVLVVLLARYAFPWFLYHIVGTRSKELFIIATLCILLGMSWALSLFGFSLALGAFLAGLTVSESEYSHQIFADIRPFRDGLNSLFFISIGMLVDIRFILENAGFLVLLVLGIAIGKAILTTLAVTITRLPLRIGILVGLSLAQIGEFSFILLETGIRNDLVGRIWYQRILSAAVVTMILTPLFFWISQRIMANNRLYALIKRFGKNRSIAELDAQSSAMQDHVIICGFGITGQNIAGILKANRIPYLILELNARTMREQKLKGQPIFYGDCTDASILLHAGIMKARVILIALSDPAATRAAVQTSRSLNQEIVILARNKYLAEIDELCNLGASEVISEEFEASIELLARILRVYHMPRQAVAQEIKSIRDERYRIFRHLDTTIPRLRLSTNLDVYTETHRIEAHSPLCGLTISESELRQKTGALILGIVREKDTLNNPHPAVTLEAGNLLIMSGTKDQLKKAIDLLRGDAKITSHFGLPFIH